MKKIFFMLLGAAMMLLGCETKHESEQPTQPETITEADYVIKFYTCDSLLKYTTYTIRDKNDSTLDCSGAVMAHPDVAGQDQRDWEAINDVLQLLQPSCSLNQQNIEIITLMVHLKKGQHTFVINYTYNNIPFAMPEMDVLVGGSYYSTTTGITRSSHEASPMCGLETSNFVAFLDILNDRTIKINF